MPAMLKVLLGAVHRMVRWAISGETLRNRGVGPEHQVVVDLVGDDDQVVPQAEVRQGLQLRPGPHPAHRVVGGAEHQGFGAGGEAALHVVKVKGVEQVLLLQGTPDRHTVPVLRRVEEGAVHRAGDEDLIPGSVTA